MLPTDGTSKAADDRPGLGRRSYLRAVAGAGVLSAVGIGSAGATEDFDVVEVPAGDTYSLQLGDGDSLENTLIDITADGAEYQITAIGSGWTIRNVGVRGAWDSYEKAEPLIASVPDPNGSARIENLYLGDGAPDDTYPGATGIFVSSGHAGTLEIDRVNIQGYPDNAIYGSSPGNTTAHPSGEGSGGEVHVTNSYAANCRAGGFRVGTNGSYVENCVAVGCDRNVWGFYEAIDVIDCDLSDGQMGDVGTGDGQWGADAEVRVRNTRFGTTVEHSGRVVGESAGRPRRTNPEDVDGVPLTPEEAASGASGSRPDDGSGDDRDDVRTGDDDEEPDSEEGDEREGDGPSEELPRTIVIDGTDADAPSTYSFRVTGAVEPTTYRDATIDDDTAVDGTAVEGTVDGTRDAYRFSGDLADFWLSGDALVDIEYDAP